MRKNDLIKMLQSIKGNPDIMLWNGLVGDVVPLDKNMIPVELYKDSLDYIKKLYEFEYIRQLMQTLPSDMNEDEQYNIAYIMLHENKQLLDKLHRSATKKYSTKKYEYRTSVNDEFLKSGKLKCKKVLVLQARKTGKTCWDRAGSIRY